MTERTKGRMRKKNKPKPVPVAHKEEAQADDRISQLSDDILVCIISRLSLREATATSILSSRWHHLHTRVSHLIFPSFSTVLEKIEVGKWPLIIEHNFRKYIKTVNHIMDSYKGGRTLKEFRVNMICSKGPNVKRCLKFALSREVEILDILRPIPTYYGEESDLYSLQLENLIESGCQTGLKCLRELSLCYVVVGDVEINLLLSNSPHLESFSLDCINMPGNVSIVGHSKLQHLSITHPAQLESIEIKNMPNLVSLRCLHLHMSPPGFVLVDNLPKLIELATSDEGSDRSTLCHILSKSPSCICSQLVVVRVVVRRPFVYGPYPELINVKHLELQCDLPDFGHSAGQLVKLLLACSSLETLEMKTVWHLSSVKHSEMCRESSYYWAEKAPSKLKKVKLSGYVGFPMEFQFARYIIGKAEALEELIVEPCRASNHIRHKTTANFWKLLRPIIPESLNVKFI